MPPPLPQLDSQTAIRMSCQSPPPLPQPHQKVPTGAHTQPLWQTSLPSTPASTPTFSNVKGGSTAEPVLTARQGSHAIVNR